MPNGPVGEVWTAPTWFTKCVAKDKYKNPSSLGWTIGPGIVGKEACDYLLGGKLVCLDGNVCAIGAIVHIEPVGYHKSGFEQIDNDFCINLLLFPHELGEFGPSTGPTDKLSNWNQVRNDGIQGQLIDDAETASITPREGAAGESTPYSVTYLFGVPGGPSPYEPHEDKTEAKLEEVKQDAAGIKRIEIPVLHSEFEGSRIFAVCTAVAPFLDLITGGPGSGACRKTIGWLPGGKLFCTFVEWVVAAALFPLIAAAAAAAWAAAGASDALWLTGPISRQVKLGDRVIITGRWVWDGGHSGYNELHATFTLQRIVYPEKTTAGFPADEARDFVDRWCRLKMQVPPRFGFAAAGLAQMTPEQQEVHGAQQLPENRWEIHPAIDGCAPSRERENGEQPPPPPVPH